MLKFETYCALMRLIDIQELRNAKKLSKILNIKQVEAKRILVGDVMNFNDSEIIRFTSTLILLRLNDGT